MGNLCSSPQRVPSNSKKDPIVYKKESGNLLYEIKQGNICSEKVDVLVNPSNAKLQATGGVSQTIIEVGGEKLQEEIKKIMAEKESLGVGEVVKTEGGKLPAKHILHVVLPVWRGGNDQESEQFVLGIMNALFEADKLGAKSVAIPALGGAGVGTFPKEEITKGLINACVEYSKDTNTKTIETIRFVSSDLALVKHLQDVVELTFSPKTEEETKSADHKEVLPQIEEPKSHAAQETTESTHSTKSPAKEEPKEHVEAQSKPEHVSSSNEETKKEEPHKNEEHEKHEETHKPEEHQKVEETHKHEEHHKTEEHPKEQAEEGVKQEAEEVVVEPEQTAVQTEEHAPQKEEEQVKTETEERQHQESPTEENKPQEEKVQEGESH